MSDIVGGGNWGDWPRSDPKGYPFKAMLAIFGQKKCRLVPFKLKSQNGIMLVFADDDDEGILEELGIRSSEDALSRQFGQLVREMPGRSTWRVCHSAGICYLKKHRQISKWGIGDQKATGSLEASRIFELDRAGFSVPKLIASGEHRPSANEIHSFLLMHSAGERHLLSALKAGQRPPQAWWLGLSRELSKFHQHGYVHRDYYANHLHFEVEEWSTPCVIDVQRVFRPKILKSRWLIKDLASLRFSCGDYLPDEMHDNFLQQYLDHLGCGQQFSSWKNKVMRKSAAISKHTPKYP